MEPIAGATDTSAAPDSAVPQQPRQGFLTGLISNAKDDWAKLKATRDAEAQVATTTIDAIKKGDYGTAAETLLDHLAGRAVQVGQGIIDVGKGVYQNAKANLSQLNPLNKGVPFDPAHPERTQQYNQPIFPAGSPVRLSAAGEDVLAAVPKPVPKLVNPFSKIEPAVATQTAKAGLAPGEEGLTKEVATAKTAQAALDAKVATQTNVDQALQNIAGQHALENKIAAPAAGTASRDIITANGDALVEAGKANYKILDKYTDSQFTNAQQELKNAQFERLQKIGTTDADPSELNANVARAQANVENLFDTAVKNGMPKETADAARTQFRTGQATLDAGNDVRIANRVRGKTGERTTDLNVLENRWTAQHDAGRLQQAFGEQGAKDALNQIHAAREAADVFDALPSTESQALRELIQKNTTTGKFGTTTNWGKVRDAFSQMPDRAARFSDVPTVEKFINNQKFYQRLRQIGAGAIGTAAAGGTTYLGYEGVKAATE
jgi:hypothetical protein